MARHDWRVAHKIRQLLAPMLWLLAQCAGAAPMTDADGEGLEGRWQGLADYGGSPIRFELTVSSQGGQTAATLDLADLGLSGAPLSIKHVDGKTLRAGSAIGNISARLDNRSHTLTVSVEREGEAPSVVELRQHHPAFVAFEHPRLDADGRVLNRYRYTLPQTSEWPVARASAQHVDEDILEQLVTRIVNDQEGQIDALLVARDGRLILEEYFFGNTVESLHTVQSVTKSVTSLLFGAMLAEHAEVSLDDPVYRFFPQYPRTQWIKQQYDVRLKHLLTMSANINWNEELPYTDPANSNTAMNASDDWLGYVLERSLSGAPGGQARYTSGLALLLGGVLKEITGEYVDAYAQQTLFRALGIDKFRWSAAPDGTRHTGGGLSMRALDLAKLGQLVLDQGKWRGQQIIPAAYLADSLRRLPLAAAPDDKEHGYGYLWWLRTFREDRQTIDAVTGIGYGGQYLGVFPSKKLVVVIFASEYEPSEAYDMDRSIRSVIQALR